MRVLINLSILILIMGVSTSIYGQVGINTDSSAPDPSAMLDVESTNKGVLVPRMTTSQRSMISNAAVGLLVFDLNTETFWFHDSVGWEELVSGSVKQIADSDNDTKIQVEESPDEDVIKFNIGGVESLRLRLNTSGVPLALLPNSSMNNTIYGKAAGLNVASQSNAIFGAFAGTNTSTGEENTIVGSSAGTFNTTGSRNTLLGFGSGNEITTGNGNSYLGAYAGFRNESGSRNVLAGTFAGANNESGTDNVMLGAGAGENSEGGGNVFIGRFAGKNETSDNKLYIQNTDSSDPLIYGEFDNDLVRINGDLEVTGNFPSNSILSDTDGDTKIEVDNSSDNDKILFTVNDIAVGGIDSFARLDVIPPTANNDGNLLIGGGNNGTGGGLNTFIGDAAALPHASGISNTAVGRSAMREHVTGSDNTSIGTFTLYDNVNGEDNTAVGTAAGNHNLGSGNIFLGNRAGFNNVNGTNQLYIENSSSNDPLIYGEFDNDLVRINGDLEVTGNFPSNTILSDTDGDTKIQVEESGDEDIIRFDLENTEILRLSKNANGITLVELPSSGANSTLYGQDAGKNLSTGQNNTFIGKGAGQNVTTGELNTFLGRSAGINNNGSFNIFIGQSAGFNETGSGRLYIHPDASSTPLIYGEFNNQLLRINGDLEVTGSLQGGNPIGTIQMWPIATPPEGWLICDGTSIPTEYTELINLVGANTPDLIGRFALGAGERNEGSNHPLLSTGGQEDVKLDEDNIPAHNHKVTIGYREGAENGQGQDYSDLGASTNDQNASKTYETDSWGGSANGLTLPHENMPPYLTIHYIIRAK